MSQRVAQTILQQLGGNRFIAMTGAKGLVSGSTYLQMDVRGKNLINRVIIRLNRRDYYDIEFGRYIPRKLKYEIVDKKKDVSVTNLCSVFTESTGLHTSL